MHTPWYYDSVNRHRVYLLLYKHLLVICDLPSVGDDEWWLNQHVLRYVCMYKSNLGIDFRNVSI